MNNVTEQQHLSAPVVDELLESGVQMTDTLLIDLYGSGPDGEDGHLVSGITVSGSKVDISELFTGAQLDNFSRWLDYKDSTSESLRRVSARELCEATRPPYDRNRGLS
jgi:hypothetical protein